jgi:hypothetical protein
MESAFKKVFSHIKERLGLDLFEAVDENEWAGDTVSGFYTEYDVCIEKLDEEIDRFIESFKAKP